MTAAEDLRFPDVDLNIYSKNNPVDVPILKSEIATRASSPNIIRHIVFDLSGTELEGRFVAGQSIGILPPGLNEKGKPHVLRLYSICSPSFGEDGQGRQYATTVKRLIGEHWDTQQLFTGVCSNYLSSLRPGDMVKVTGPSGKRFILPEQPEQFNYVFFATGTGIAPFRGMVMELMKRGNKKNIALVFGSPYRTDLLYDSFFRGLDERESWFHYLPTISRENPRTDGSRPYVQSQLTDRADLLKPILERDDTLIYVCGLKGMETGIIQGLAANGLHQYLKYKEELSGDPIGWDEQTIRRSIKPSGRMFLEVY